MEPQIYMPFGWDTEHGDPALLLTVTECKHCDWFHATRSEEDDVPG